MSTSSSDRSRAASIAVLVAVALALAFLYFRGTAVDEGEADGGEIGADPSSGQTSSSGDEAPPPTLGLLREARASESSPIRLSPAESIADPGATRGVLAGRVISWSSSLPVASAELTFAFASRAASVTTSADGAFTYHPSAVGLHTLSLVTADGFHPYAPEWDTSPLAFRAVAGNRVQGVVIYLVPAVDYAGVVLSADGEPAPSAAVRLIDRGDGETALVPPEAVAWQTREDGTFDAKAPDGALLEATHPELGRGRARVDFSAQASRRITITLSTDAEPGRLESAISGVVRVEDGTPLPEVVVYAMPEPDNEADPAEQLHPSGHATTDGQGRFAIERLDVGPHMLFARAAGYAAARERAPAPSDDVELMLGREALLEGTVTDAETGAPLASSTVLVQRRLGPLTRRVVSTATTFGSDGRYVVHGLSPGSYEVIATAHGYVTSEPRPVVVDGEDPTEVALSLGRGATISGSVTSGEDGPPITDARVTLEGQLGAQNSAVPILVSAATDAGGRFALTGVPPGSRSLFIAGHGHHGRVLSGLLVTEGAALEITIDLTPTEEGEAPRIELVGIGAVLSARGEGLVIGRAVEGGGAAEAGLRVDDVILAVDGVPITELGFGGAIERIRGPEGSTLVLRIRRAGADSDEEIVVTRKRIRA